MTCRLLAHTPRPRTVARGAAAAIALCAAAALSATSAVAQSGDQGVPPFASGTLSSVSGSTLQVQATTGARTVVVTKSTEYRQVKPAASSDIVAGDCVRVFGSGSTTTGIQATTVSVEKPSAKGCTAGFQNQNGSGGFRNGAPRGDGRFQGPPNGSSAPNGNSAAGPATRGGTGPGSSGDRNMGVAIGTVKSVSGNQLVVKARPMVRRSSNDDSKRTTKPTSKTVEVTVSLGDSTAVTRTVAASAGDLAVGACVNAAGTTDSVGTVTAATVTISQPQNGSCPSVGFGGFGRGAPPSI